MKYVKRTPGGLIMTATDKPITGYESIEDDDPELINFEIEYNNMVVIENLEKIDYKRIRAICEGGVNEETGKTFLEEYNEQAIAERAKIIK